MFNKILVPVDGSDLAEAVFPHVQSLAQDMGAEVILLRVNVDASEYALADPYLAGSMLSKLEAEVKSYMASAEAKFKASNIRVTTQLADGPVAETILKIAEDKRADLIAMSTHGRSGMARWLLGSVADRVVRSSKAPVLLVRPSSMSGA